jgi:hypothetical protein
MRHRPSRPALVLLLVLLGGCAADRSKGLSESLDPWAEFSVRASLARPVEVATVHVGDLRYAGADGSEKWLRKTTTFFGGGSRVQWTDTRSCPAAGEVLSRMYDLEMPRPIEGGIIEAQADGLIYELSADAEFTGGRRARLSVGASGGTPLANWMDRSLAELEPCWSDLPPAEISTRR